MSARENPPVAHAPASITSREMAERAVAMAKMAKPTRETPAHSPAPWSEDERGRVRDAQGRLVCTPHGKVADDRLILKAPDLLAACRDFVLECERGGIIVGIRHHVDAMKALVDHIDGGGA